MNERNLLNDVLGEGGYLLGRTNGSFFLQRDHRAELALTYPHSLESLLRVQSGAHKRVYNCLLSVRAL